jgi:hypothetical protein
MTFRSTLACLALSLAAIAGCTQAIPTTDVVRLSSPAAAPPTTGAVTAPVLTVSGRIDSPDGVLELDLESIDRMGLVRYVAHDPWLDLDTEFTGVLVVDLLAAVGAAEDATTIHITALDDYQVDLAVADMRRWPIMLATQAAGQRMSIEDKGPSRIVYPADPAIDVLRTKDLWIWQISSIEVR